MSLRVAFFFNNRIESLDPRRVNTVTEATLLRNLYCSLFDYDFDGQLVTGLAGSFKWNNGALEIELRQDKIASDGLPITAEDALISLKRLMVEGENLHGDLREILCPSYALNSASDPCPGIWIEKNTLILKPVNQKLAKNLIPLLASVDYRVIPRRALDLNKRIPSIETYHVTSGPFFLEKDDGQGNFTLAANKHHYLYSVDMPQKIVNIPVVTNIADLIVNDKIDLVPTTTPVTLDELATISNSSVKIEIKKTHNLRIRMLFFGFNAVNEFTAEQRFQIAQIMETRANQIRLPFEEHTVEFFQEFGEGHLTSDQRTEISKIRQTKSTAKLTRQPTVGVTNIKSWGTFFENHQECKPMISGKHAAEMKIEDRPDVYSGLNDVAFNTGMTLLSYNLKQGTFGVYGSEADSWLRNYLETDERSKQIQMINSMHFNALKECYLFPLSASPYFTITNSMWSVSLNPFFAATQLWKIKSN